MYITYEEFINSPYGAEYNPVSGSIFETSGNVVDFLESVSSIIDLYCGRTFDIVLYEETKYGLSGKSIFLDNIPVTGIVSIEWSTGFGSSGVVSPTSYLLLKPEGRIISQLSLKQDFLYTIKYHAGFSVIPDPIRYATLVLAKTLTQSLESGSLGIPDGGTLTSFKFGKFAEEYANSQQKYTDYAEAIPPTVCAILKKYRYMKA